MVMVKQRSFVACVALASIGVMGLAACSAPAKPPASAPAAVSVRIIGGFETDSRDNGRPVVLIASALGVPPEVFRDAFSQVTPAGAGEQPDPRQVDKNKQALLQKLGPYGITNARLDEVSNHYRYNGSAGEHWPTVQATATPVVVDGKVTGFTITNAGAGYSSTPKVEVIGAGQVNAKATVTYTNDFRTNGSVTSIDVTG